MPTAGKTQQHQLLCILASSAVGSVFLQPRLLADGRQSALCSLLLLCGALLFLLLFQDGMQQLQSRAGVVLLLLNLLCCGFLFSALERFLVYTGFCDIGPAALTLLLYFLFCSVFQKGENAAGRFAVFGALAIGFLLLLYAFFGRNIASTGRISFSDTGSGQLLAALPQSLLAPVLALPIFLCGGVSKSRRSAIFAAASLFLLPAVFVTLSEAVLAGFLEQISYPVYEVGLCMDGALLQRLDGIIFGCVLMLVLVESAAHAAACRMMLREMKQDSPAARRGTAFAACFSFLLFQSEQTRGTMLTALCYLLLLSFLLLVVFSLWEKLKGGCNEG